MGRKKQLIKNIIKNFDFERVATAMQALDWTWGGDSISPSVSEMKDTAKRCLKSAYKQAKQSQHPNVTYICSTGGFKASAICNEDGVVDFLELEFIIASWDESN